MVYAVSINEILSGERLTQEEYKEKAEENLKEAISKSIFSLEEKKEFFKNKWNKEHLLGRISASLCIAAIFAVGIKLNNGLQIIGALALIVVPVVNYNRMMAYVEAHVFDRK